MTTWSPKPRRRPPSRPRRALRRRRISKSAGERPVLESDAMNLFSRKINQTLMAVGLTLVAGAALAQAPATEAPGRPDVKTVGDWTVRCFPIQSPSPCDIFQEQDYQKTGQRVLSVSIAYVPSMDKHAIQ